MRKANKYLEENVINEEINQFAGLYRQTYQGGCASKAVEIAYLEGIRKTYIDINVDLYMSNIQDVEHKLNKLCGPVKELTQEQIDKIEEVW